MERWAVQPTMSNKKPAYIKGSVVNNVLHQNLLALRQRQADIYWAKRAEEIRNAEKPKSKRRAPRFGSERKSKNQKEYEAKVEEEETTKIIYKLVTEFISLQREDIDWEPGSNKPLPNPKSQRAFAEEVGIDYAHYKEVEAGRVAMTVDDAVKIARANDIDLMTLLLPDIENLEKNDFIDLEPIHPVHGRIRMYEWVLWIFGYRPLPGQDANYFRNATATPKAYLYAVSGKKPREAQIVNAELKRRKTSKVSAWSEMEVGNEPKSWTDLDTPFDNDPALVSESLNTSHRIISATLTIAGRMKIAFQSDKPKSLDAGAKRFRESMKRIRNRVIFIVYTLRSLGK